MNNFHIQGNEIHNLPERYELTYFEYTQACTQACTSYINEKVYTNNYYYHSFAISIYKCSKLFKSPI